MARPVDERIVRMKLDNSDFKSKAAKTTGLLGKLTAGLNKIPGVNLGKTTQELGNMQDAVQNTRLDHLTDGISQISSRFSTMGILAATVLNNIANRAIDTGLQVAKSLSVDQVMAGFQEYELKMGSIQTILANTQQKGSTLDDVNRELDNLNEYADKTIYNFAEMTRNIGLFTNAGLGLEESTSMIQGFSNAAAASGAKSEEAGRAAYQLSQGLSQGYLMTMDWMSLTNAGMGNDNMKRDLIALGQAMGTLDKSTDDTLTSWKETLSEDQWLTTDVMSTYLQAMAGDMDEAKLKAIGLTEAQADLLMQNAKTGEDAATKVRTFTQLMDTMKEAIGSGWAESFQHIFGDFEEATELFSGWSKSADTFFGEMSRKRNDFIKGIADGGGFLDIFEGIGNAAKPVWQVFNSMRDGFQSIFPPASVDRVLELAEAFKEFTAGLTLSKQTTEQLTTIFAGVFSVFSTVWEISKRLASAFIQLIPEGTGSAALDLLEKIARLAISFNESIKEGNGLTEVIDGLGSVLSSIGDAIATTIGLVSDLGGSLREGLGNAIDWVKDKLAPFGDFMKSTFGEGIGGDEILGAGFLVGAFAIFKKLSGMFDDFMDNSTGLVDSITEIFDGIGDAISEFTSSIKYINLMMIAVSIGILAASLKTLEGLETEDIAKGITALATSLGTMIAGMMIMSKFNVTGGLRVSATLIALAAATNIMANALVKIAELDTDELIRGIGGLVGVTVALSAAVIAIGKFGGKISASSLQLLALAGAVVILADAVETMADIDAGSLFKSIGALTLIFAQLALFMKVVDRTKFGIGSALGLIAVAGAVQMMVDAIQDIDSVDVPALIKGLSTIGLLLAQIAIFSRVVGGTRLLAAGVGMIAIAGALNLLVPPIKELGNMSWEELGKGLGAMAVALAAVAASAMLMQGSLAGAAGVLLMATALTVLAGPIQTFANMTWGELIKGFAGVAGGLALLAGAALLLSPAIVPMLGFGVALLALGTAVALAGAGIALFGTGLATLATLTATSVAAIVSALALLIEGLLGLIPRVVNFVVELGIALIDGIGRLIPPLVDTGTDLILSLMETISEKLPRFIELGVDIILKLIEGIGNSVEPLTMAATNLVITVIESLAQSIRANGPRMTSAFLEILGEILILFVDAGVQVVNALFGWMPGVQSATAKIGSTAEQYIRDNFGAAQAGSDKGGEFVTGLSGTTGAARGAGVAVGTAGMNGAGSVNVLPTGTAFGSDFASGIDGQSGLVNSMGTGLGETGRDGAGSISPLGEGTDFGLDFANGIEGTGWDAESAGIDIAGEGKDGAGSLDMGNTGVNFGLGFAGGINSRSVLSSVASAGWEIAKKAKDAVAGWLDMRSPSKLMEKDGGYFTEGFARGIAKQAKMVGDKAKGVAQTARDSLNEFLEGFDPGPEDNEIRFKVVVDDDDFDPNDYNPSPIQPDTSFTRTMASAARIERYPVQQETPKKEEESKNPGEDDKRPAIVQVVTPDRRELARWLVDDVTEFQEFNIETPKRF